jgi:hypothetical protein
VDVDEQVLRESAGGDSIPNVLLPDVILHEVRPDRSVCNECTVPRHAEDLMVIAAGSGSQFIFHCFLCSNLFISDIEDYTSCVVFGSLKVYCIYEIYFV